MFFNLVVWMVWVDDVVGNCGFVLIWFLKMYGVVSFEWNCCFLFVLFFILKVKNLSRGKFLILTESVWTKRSKNCNRYSEWINNFQSLSFCVNRNISLIFWPLLLFNYALRNFLTIQWNFDPYFWKNTSK